MIDSHAQTQQSCCTLDKRPVGGPPIFLFLLIHFFLFRGRTPRGSVECSQRRHAFGAFFRYRALKPMSRNRAQNQRQAATRLRLRYISMAFRRRPRAEPKSLPRQAKPILYSRLSSLSLPRLRPRDPTSKRAGWVPVGAPLPLSLARMIWQLPSYLAGPAEGCPRVPS